MTSQQQNSVKVFYDGLCRVCSAEINTYKKMNGSHSIHFIDITSPEFDAQVYHLDPFKIHKEIHGFTSDGKLTVGVDTFILIWDSIPRLQWLGHLARKKTVRALLDQFYKGFVIVRPYLPRKSCEASPYCEIKRN